MSEVTQAPQVGIKETLEVLKAAGKLVEVAGLIAADGKVNVSDLPHLLNLLKELSVFTEAVKDIKLVDDELKNLNQEELLALGSAGFAIAKQAVAIFKK
jgi:hypothetical protein